MSASDERSKVPKLSKFVNFERFRLCLNDFLNDEPYVPDDVNSLCEFLIKGINSAELISTSYKVVQKRKKELLCPWITKDIITLCNYKSNLLKKIKCNARNISVDLLKFRLNAISNVIIYKKRIEKQKYYCEMFQNSSSFKTWQNIKKVLGTNEIKNSKIQRIIVNDNQVTDDDLIAEEFNEYYTTVASTLSNNILIDDVETDDYLSSLPAEIDSIFLYPTDENEVIEEIFKLDSSKSHGFDDIYVDLLKSCASIISPFICILINLIFTLGIYPEILKLAKVIPIFEAGDATQTGNYRPISLLSILNKIIERLLFKRLTAFLIRNNFFFCAPIWFSKGI